MSSISKLRGIGFVVATIIILLDQLSKMWIIAEAKAHMLPMFVSSVFNVVLVFNRGISFGMLAQTGGLVNYVLPVCLFLITCTLVVWLLRADNRPLIMALGLIIGGAVGNLLDRASSGVVTDFLDFHYGYYHWPAFNIADSSIFMGVVLFLLTNIIGKEKNKEVPKV